jgi:hypothetical protein
LAADRTESARRPFGAVRGAAVLVVVAMLVGLMVTTGVAVTAPPAQAAPPPLLFDHALPATDGFGYTDSQGHVSAGVLADATGDGVLDVPLVVRRNVAGVGLRTRVEVRSGNGVGGFGAPTVALDLPISGPGPGPGSIYYGASAHLLDLVGTSAVDLVVTSTVDGLVHIHPGVGDGTFGAEQTVAGLLGGNVRGADVDGDGRLDLAMVGTWGTGDYGKVVVLRNTVGGWVRQDLASGGQTDIAFIDLTGGGRPAMVGTTGPAAVFPNDGTGVYGSPTTLPFTDPRSFTVGDFDGLGGEDLLLGNQFGEVVLFANDGAGGLVQRPGSTRLPTAYATAAPNRTTTDVDGDGRVDAVIASSSTVSVVGVDAGGALQARQWVMVPRQDVAAGYGQGVYSATAVDLDGDTRPDLLSGLGGSPSGLPDLAVARQDPGAPGRFLAPNAFNTDDNDGGSRSVALGDMDADGVLDLVYHVHTPFGARLRIGRGQGDGTFAAPVEAGSAGSSCGGAAKIDLTDFDGDDELDVLCLNGTAAVAFGDGAGHVGSATGLPLNSTGVSGGVGRHHALADFDTDGHPDVVFTVTNNCCPYGEPWIGSLVVQRYNPANPRTFVTDGLGIDLGRLSGPESVTAGDFDGDGRPDIVFRTGRQPDGSAGERFSFYKGNGDGTFAAAVSTAPGLPQLDQMVSGDVDGDGDLDVVGAGSGQIVVLPGNGDGTFAAPLSSPSDAAFDVVLADLNADGRRDIVTGSWNHGVQIRTVTAGGVLSDAGYLPTAGPRVDGAVVGDLDGDDRADLVTTVYTNPHVTVIKNRSAVGPGGPPDLRPTSITAPAVVTPGSSGDITYTVRNQGGPLTGASWIDRVYLSTDDVWDPTDRLFASVSRATDLAGGESYTQTVTAPFLPLQSGPHRVIVRSDLFNDVTEAQEANNLLVMPGSVDLTIPVLAPGATADLTLADGQLAYLQVAPSGGPDQLLALTSAVDGVAELVVGNGRLPTPTDGRDLEAADLDHPEILLPAVGQTRFVLVRGPAGTGTPVQVSLRNLVFEITSVSPDAGSNQGSATVVVRGAGFAAGATAMLDRAGTTRTATTVVRHDATHLEATFDLTGLAPGDADLTVMNPGGASATAPGSFTVTTDAPGRIEATLTNPGRMRTNWVATATITVRNTGGTDLPVPLVRLAAGGKAVFKPSGSSTFVPGPLAFFPRVPGGPTLAVPPGGEIRVDVPFLPSNELIGDVIAGGTAEIPFRATVISAGTPESFDWPAVFADYRPAGLTDETWASVIAFVNGGSPPTSWGAYAALLAEADRTAAGYGLSLVTEADRLRFVVDEALVFAPGASVTGRVRLPDGAGAVGARLQAVAVDGAATQEVRVWPDGSYALRDLPAGGHRLEAFGYVQDVVPEVVVVDGAASVQDVVVTPGELVRGVVSRPPVGAPLEGARVTLFDAVTARTFAVVTGPDGRYELPGMRAGTHQLRIEADGYLSDGPVPVAVAAGSGGGRDLTMALGSSIAGVVRGPGGAPIEGATVAVVGADAEARTAATGPDGSYLVSGVRSGTHTVSAGIDGLGSASQSGLTVADGEAKAGVDLVLLAGAGLTGVVRDGVGAPVPGAAVTVADPPGVRHAVTGPDGIYSVGSLGAGSRRVVVSAAGHVESSLDVDVAAGVVTTRDISLIDLGSISGTVRLPDDSPVPSLSLRLVDSDGQPVATARTDAAGAYRFGDLEAGTYVVAVQGNLGQQTVTLANGDGAVQDFVVGVGVLQGRVVDGLGAPLPFAELQVSPVGPADARPVTNLAGPDGRFSIVVRPGSYELVSTDRRAPFASTGAVNVALASTVDVGDLAATGVSWRVRVTSSATGRPAVPGAAVALEANGATITGRTDADGVLALAGVPEGPYSLLVRSDGLASTRRDITVTAPDTTSDVDLGVGHVASGQVLDGDGNPPALAIVTLVERSTGEVFSTATEPDGSWHLDMLPPGAVLDGWAVDRLNPAVRVVGVTAAPPPLGSLSRRAVQAAGTADSRGTSFLPPQPITGQVSDSDGRWSSGATVDLVDPATGQVLETTTTGTDGSYRFAGLSDLAQPVNVRVSAGGRSKDAFDTPKPFGDLLQNGGRLDLTDMPPADIPPPEPPTRELRWAPPPDYVAILAPPPPPGVNIGPDDPNCPPVHAAWLNAQRWADQYAENQRLWAAAHASYGDVWKSYALPAVRALKLAADTYALVASLGGIGWFANVATDPTVLGRVINVGIDPQGFEDFLSTATNVLSGLWNVGVADIWNPDSRFLDGLNAFLATVSDKALDIGKSFGSQSRAGKLGVVGSVLSKALDAYQIITDLRDALRLEQSLVDNLKRHKRNHEFLGRQLGLAHKALDAARKQGCRCPDGKPRPPSGQCPDDPPDSPAITQRPDGQWVIVIDGRTFVVNSRDPNSIDGPAGTGPPRFVTEDQPLAYTVHFENVATASAPAQEVVVTHQLDPDVDLDSFELGDIGFGATRIEVPDGRRSFDATVPLDGTPYSVAVTAGLDLDTGVVTWRLRTIDPQTGDLPADPDAGFLPPNVTAPAGEGFADYTATARDGTPIGATVDAAASIVFDQNPPIATNTWTNTIGVLLPPTAGGFHPLTPVRTLDTRALAGGSGIPFGPGETRTLAVAGQGGVPDEGVSAVAVNVTAVQPTAATHLTVWPTGEPLPDASNLNAGARQTIPNLVISAVGADGTISIRNNSGTVHVLADVVGWFDLGGGSTVGLPAGGGAGVDGRGPQALPPVEPGAAYVPLTPSRILDTRAGATGPAPVGAGEQRDVDVTGVGGVPDDGVTAVVVNVTAVQPTSASHLTVWPAGVARPDASNLNFPARTTIPNLVIARVGADGEVSLFNNSGDVHVLFDVVGYFTTTEPLGSFHGLTPSRILDTRAGTGGPDAPFAGGEARDLPVAGRGGVPSSGATAVVLNVTAVNPSAASHLTVWPAGVARPDASNLNFAENTIPNLVVVKLGPDGAVSLFNNSGEVDVLADVVGYLTE